MYHTVRLSGYYNMMKVAMKRDKMELGVDLVSAFDLRMTIY